MDVKDIAPVGEGYSKDVKAIVEILSTPRNIEEYAGHLGFKSQKEFLQHIPQNALLLDIGSGNNLFSSSMKTKRADVTVFNFNPAMAVRYERNLAISKGRLSNDVAGINPWLSYKDQAFDVVLDSMGSIYYADGLLGMTGFETTEKKLNEIVRVLKPGGFAAVGPLINDQEINHFIDTAKKIKGIEMNIKGSSLSTNAQSFHIRKFHL